MIEAPSPARSSSTIYRRELTYPNLRARDNGGPLLHDPGLPPARRLRLHKLLHQRKRVSDPDPIPMAPAQDVLHRPQWHPLRRHRNRVARLRQRVELVLDDELRLARIHRGDAAAGPGHGDDRLPHLGLQRRRVQPAPDRSGGLQWEEFPGTGGFDFGLGFSFLQQNSRLLVMGWGFLRNSISWEIQGAVFFRMLISIWILVFGVFFFFFNIKTRV